MKTEAISAKSNALYAPTFIIYYFNRNYSTMKHLLFVLSALTSSTCYSQQANDSAAIVKLLKEDYATMGTLDRTAHLNNVTSDYVLIEKGEIWDIQTELDSIYKSDPKIELIRTDFFTIKTVKISGDMAYAIWHLRSEFKQNGTVTERTWNESGVFRKEKGRWKIALIHSSRERQK